MQLFSHEAVDDGCMATRAWLMSVRRNNRKSVILHLPLFVLMEAMDYSTLTKVRGWDVPWIGIMLHEFKGWSFNYGLEFHSDFMGEPDIEELL